MPLIAVLVGCAPILGERDPDMVTEPTSEQVDESLAFGNLAPLPPGAEVDALRRKPGRDPWIILTIRMPRGDAEPYLVASGLGRYDASRTAASLTVDERRLPRTVPVTASTQIPDGSGRVLSREAACEPIGENMALVHLWLYAL